MIGVDPMNLAAHHVEEIAQGELVDIDGGVDRLPHADHRFVFVVSDDLLYPR